MVHPSVFFRWFDSFREPDFARSGNVASQTVMLEEGPLESFSHAMEPQMRQLGLPTSLKRGRTPSLPFLFLLLLLLITYPDKMQVHPLWVVPRHSDLSEICISSEVQSASGNGLYRIELKSSSLSAEFISEVWELLVYIAALWMAPDTCCTHLDRCDHFNTRAQGLQWGWHSDSGTSPHTGMCTHSHLFASSHTGVCTLSSACKVTHWYVYTLSSVCKLILVCVHSSVYKLTYWYVYCTYSTVCMLTHWDVYTLFCLQLTYWYVYTLFCLQLTHWYVYTLVCVHTLLCTDLSVYDLNVCYSVTPGSLCVVTMFDPSLLK